MPIIAVRHGETFRTEKKITIQGGDCDDELAQLSPEGMKDACALAEGLFATYKEQILNGKILIFTSPLGRCRDTARIIEEIFAKNAATGVAFTHTEMKDLEEIRHGKFESMKGKVRDENCAAWYREEEKRRSEAGTLTQDWKWDVNPLTQKKHDTNEPVIPLEEHPKVSPELSSKDPETINKVRERVLRAFHEIADACEKHDPSKETVAIVVTSGVAIWSQAVTCDARDKKDTAPFPVYYGGQAGVLYPKTCSISKFDRDADKQFHFQGTINLK